MICEYAYNEKHELVHVDSVPNGLACNCTCIWCNAKMEAKNGGEIRDHHFAHYDKKDCEGYYETLMHLWSKEIIAEEKCVMLPDGEKMEFIGTEIEERNDFKDLQPDIVGINKDDSRFWIEIAVTHKCDDNKRRKIIENKTDCLEIQVPETIDSKDTLRDFLIGCPDDRYFIYTDEFRRLLEEYKILCSTYDKYPRMGNGFFEMCRYWKSIGIVGFTAKDRRERYIPWIKRFRKKDNLTMSYEDLIRFLKDNLDIKIFQEDHTITVILKLCGEVISLDSHELY